MINTTVCHHEANLDGAKYPLQDVSRSKEGKSEDIFGWLILFLTIIKVKCLYILRKRREMEARGDKRMG